MPDLPSLAIKMVTIMGRLVPPVGKQRVYILERELSPARGGKGGGNIEPLSPEEIAGLAEHYPIISSRVGERQERGDLCFGETRDGSVVHYSWVSTTTHSFHGTKMILGENEAYIHDVYTKPEYRRRGIAAMLIRRVLDYLRDLGRTVVYVGIYEGNDASLSLFQGMGFEIIGELTTGKVLDGKQLRSLRDKGKFVPSVIRSNGRTPELDERLNRVFRIRPR